MDNANADQVHRFSQIFYNRVRMSERRAMRGRQEGQGGIEIAEVAALRRVQNAHQ